MRKLMISSAIALAVTTGAAHADMGNCTDPDFLRTFMSVLNAKRGGEIVDVRNVRQGPLTATYIGCYGLLSFDSGNNWYRYFGYYINSLGGRVYFSATGYDFGS